MRACSHQYDKAEVGRAGGRAGGGGAQGRGHIGARWGAGVSVVVVVGRG